MAENEILKTNIAGDLKNEATDKLIRNVVEGYKLDLASRSSWEAKRADWYKISQCMPTRSNADLPWPGAANVCTPTLLSAILQFQARSYAALFEQPYEERMHALPVEMSDINSAKLVERFMNWQLIAEMEEYEGEWDRLLMELPNFGTAFTEQDWNEEENRPENTYIPAVDLVLPYNVGRLKHAFRTTHRLYEHAIDIERLGRSDFYINADTVKPGGDNAEESEVREIAEKLQGEDYEESDQKPNIVLKQRFYDKIGTDDEPHHYTAWVDLANESLYRLVRREISASGKTRAIGQLVDYHFIPNAEGFYSYGFGHYLAPINRMENTIFNLFLDAGALANNPFIVTGRTAGFKGRQPRLKPGGRMAVNDINQIRFEKMPGLGQELPVLLGFLQNMGRDITSTSDEMQGRAQKGVREPTVRGTFARIEQGLVNFGVLTKRIMRQQRQEFRNLITLNSLMTEDKKVFRVLGTTEEIFEEVTSEDLSKKFDIIVTADPSFASPQQRRNEALQLMSALLSQPLYAGNPDLGIPPNIPLQIVVLRDFLQTFGKGQYVPFVPEAPEPSIDPNIENQMLLEGQEVKPKEGENHPKHRLEHLEILAREGEEEIEGDFENLREHSDRHLEVMALEAEKAQVAAQAAENAPQGAQASGPTSGIPGPQPEG